jgi:hypothetical protein
MLPLFIGMFDRAKLPQDFLRSVCLMLFRVSPRIMIAEEPLHFSARKSNDYFIIALTLEPVDYFKLVNWHGIFATGLF